MIQTQKKQKGFTILFGVLVASLTLAIGAVIFSITFRELVLTSQARESHVAFNAANAGIECALFWDLKHPDFPGSVFGQFGSSGVFDPGDGPLTDIISHWRLDDGSGTNAVDSAGGNDGMLQGDPTWVGSGRVGTDMLDFDGNGDYIDVSSDLGQPSDITLSAWAKLDTADTSGAEVISLGNVVAIRLDNTFQGGNTTGWYYRGGSSWCNTLSSTGHAGTGWHHFAYTIDDGINEQRLYIDGQLVSTTMCSDSIDWGSSFGNTTIGRHPTSGNYDFDGEIDDVRVYDSALSPNDVESIYNTGGSFAHWEFDEGSGAVAVDSSGYGHNATLSGSPAWITGRVDGALLFDGSDDEGSPVSPDPGLFHSAFDERSLSVWATVQAGIGDTAILWEEGGVAHGFAIAYNQSSQDVQFATMQNSAQVTINSTTPVSQDDSWVHIVAVYDGGAMTLYIDGTSENTGNNGSSIPSHISNPRIGGYDGGTAFNGGETKWKGRLDQLRIFDYALTQADVDSLFEEGAGATVPPVDENSNAVCDGLDITDPANSIWSTDSSVPGQYTTTFSMPFSNGTCTVGWVQKRDDGTAQFDLRGYNTCDTENPRRVERGLRVKY